ncbi:uncharacterized protein SCHCODRAFT_02590844 [Schizophyllum commune H4-8]|uniref:Uncharacterized protein n=1 Tax=Schizophyllum commune (strain H4-8 / FGSC 9210) TaxID=578458 RepID=D8QHE1_SCHCM|nr:uncharacterized protein SCHCODRAFT_02590844 [Schizophyllum commune H4-8]KAI5887147.1 hypothetical protein SCHCODRAFT_02590844 [Schizophyllum commune H4-8]
MLAGDNVLVLYPRLSYNILCGQTTSTRIGPSTSTRVRTFMATTRVSQPRADNAHTTYACPEDLSLLRVAYFTARRICPYTAARTHGPAGALWPLAAGAAVGIHHDFSAPSGAHSSQVLHRFGTSLALGTISVVGTSDNPLSSLQHSPPAHQHSPPRAHPRGRAISASLEIPSRGKFTVYSRLVNTCRQFLRLRNGKPSFMAEAQHCSPVPRPSVIVARGRGPRVGVSSSASKEALTNPWKRWKSR